MSEVTELTNEQFVEHVRDWGCTCDLLNGYDCGHGQITGELLRRLPTQGAGPRCPKCGSDDLTIWVRGSDNVVIVACACHQNSDDGVCNRIEDFAQFFRAPSDPPRPEAKDVTEARQIAFAKGMNDEWHCYCKGCEWIRKYLSIKSEAVDEHGREVRR